ncbi:MAG: thioredoxin [Clostridia bacterium]|nr:thioredoxin [Clostridia bacterium]
MGISLYKIKKWYKMLTGQSVSHVNQGVGTCFSKNEVAGYYNDLTEKVTKDNPDILVPMYRVDAENEIYFSIGVFQYGLAAYDLFIKTQEDIYKNKVIACSEWALKNQQDDGGWLTFDYKNKEYPYSSMAQGEGISLLIRAHILTGNSDFLQAAQKAKEFMLKPICNGGTAEYTEDGGILLYEATNNPVVLNGWIFSAWGLYDFYKYFADEEAKQTLDRTLGSLKKKLPDFDIGYWSKYEDGKRICSPFYHKLHIAQLEAMHELFGDGVYKEYAVKWDKYQKSFLKPKIAFVKKALQKVFE